MGTWRRIPHVFRIIFSFLGGELTNIIKIVPSKGWVEVIFRHLIRKSLKKENYVAPTNFWENDLDLQTLQIETPKYFIFDDQQAAFVRKDFQELQAQIDTLTVEIEKNYSFVCPYDFFMLLAIGAAAGVCTYGAKEAHSYAVKFLLS